MTSNFKSPRQIQKQINGGIEMDSFGKNDTASDARGDRFELLSAYLDGEATAAERQQVQQWLDTDPQIQALYRRLLALRQAMQALPIPVAAISAEELSQKVLGRENRRKWKRTALVGGGAIAAVAVTIFSGLLAGNQAPSLRLAETPEREEQVAAETETLTIAINRPIIEIPAAAAPTGEPTLD